MMPPHAEGPGQPFAAPSVLRLYQFSGGGRQPMNLSLLVPFITSTLRSFILAAWEYSFIRAAMKAALSKGTSSFPPIQIAFRHFQIHHIPVANREPCLSPYKIFDSIQSRRLEVKKLPQLCPLRRLVQTPFA